MYSSDIPIDAHSSDIPIDAHSSGGIPIDAHYVVFQLTRTPRIFQLTHTKVVFQLTRTPVIFQLMRTPVIFQLMRTQITETEVIKSSSSLNLMLHLPILLRSKCEKVGAN